MEKMHMRMVAVYAVIAIMLTVGALRVFSISTGEAYTQAARQNGSYTLTVTQGRGSIYDCNLQHLTNFPDGYKAAVTADPQTTTAFSQVLSDDQMQTMLDRIGEGKPFVQKVEEYIPGTKALFFPNLTRYRQEDPLCPHIIGYVDGDGQGVEGIEAAYDDWLSKAQGKSKVTFSVNAVGETLAGVEPKVEDTMANVNSGVMLTIDRDIQDIAQKAAKQYLEKGAVVVLDVRTGAIRASVSLPDFDPDDVQDALSDEDAPLLNRTTSAYNVGSVFKLVTAAAALENGVSPDRIYDCTGSVDIHGVIFDCYHQRTHGIQNMEGALAQSCNAYYITLGQEIGAKKLLDMAVKMGFGSGITLCDGMQSAAGTLPAMDTLKMPAALANFSFGQGELMATPYQVASMVQCIASGGTLAKPYLVEGLVDSSGQLTEPTQQAEPVQVLSGETCDALRLMMAAPVEYGTGTGAKPTIGGAGGKTATAETGIMVDGKFVNQTWFAGYFPYDNPQYAVAVLAEDSPKGSETSTPTFRAIADGVWQLMRQRGREVQINTIAPSQDENQEGAVPQD